MFNSQISNQGAAPADNLGLTKLRFGYFPLQADHNGILGIGVWLKKDVRFGPKILEAHLSIAPRPKDAGWLDVPRRDRAALETQTGNQ
jgi:hypothetical protein